MEPTFQENEYLEIIYFLERLIEVNDQNEIDEGDDYELGFAEGEKRLAERLLMKMQSRIIAWNYAKKEGGADGSI